MKVRNRDFDRLSRLLVEMRQSILDADKLPVEDLKHYLSQDLLIKVVDMQSEVSDIQLLTFPKVARIA